MLMLKRLPSGVEIRVGEDTEEDYFHRRECRGDEESAVPVGTFTKYLATIGRSP
jgi:hypothetical protein